MDDNKLYKMFDTNFRNNFVRAGNVVLYGDSSKGDRDFWNVDVFLDDSFIYIDNESYLMMFPTSSIKKIMWRKD